MVSVTAFSCTKCGSPLELPSGIDHFACAHCGVHHSVKRGGGIVSIEPIVEGLDEIREGTDRTSSELAIKRLKKERASIKHRIQDLENAVGLSTSAAVIFGVGILAIVGLSLLQGFITGIAGGKSFILVGPSLLFGLICVGGGIILFRKWDQRRTKFKTKISSLKQQYAKKTEEIKHHKSVVMTPTQQYS